MSTESLLHQGSPEGQGAGTRAPVSPGSPQHTWQWQALLTLRRRADLQAEVEQSGRVVPTML